MEDSVRYVSAKQLNIIFSIFRMACYNVFRAFSRLISFILSTLCVSAVNACNRFCHRLRFLHRVDVVTMDVSCLETLEQPGD